MDSKYHKTIGLKIKITMPFLGDMWKLNKMKLKLILFIYIETSLLNQLPKNPQKSLNPQNSPFQIAKHNK